MDQRESQVQGTCVLVGEMGNKNVETTSAEGAENIYTF